MKKNFDATIANITAGYDKRIAEDTAKIASLTGQITTLRGEADKFKAEKDSLATRVADYERAGRVAVAREEPTTSSNLYLFLLDSFPELFEGVEGLKRDIKTCDLGEDKSHSRLIIQRMIKGGNEGLEDFILARMKDRHAEIPEEDIRAIVQPISPEMKARYDEAKAEIDFAANYATGKLPQGIPKSMVEKLMKGINLEADRQTVQDFENAEERRRTVGKKFKDEIAQLREGYTRDKELAERVKTRAENPLAIPYFVLFREGKAFDIIIPTELSDGLIDREINEHIAASCPEFTKIQEGDTQKYSIKDSAKATRSFFVRALNNLVRTQQGYLFYDLGGRVELRSLAGKICPNDLEEKAEYYLVAKPAKQTAERVAKPVIVNKAGFGYDDYKGLVDGMGKEEARMHLRERGVSGQQIGAWSNKYRADAGTFVRSLPQITPEAYARERDKGRDHAYILAHYKVGDKRTFGGLALGYNHRKAKEHKSVGE